MMIKVIGQPVRKIVEINLSSPMVVRTQAIPITGIVKVNALRSFKGQLRLIVEVEEDIKVNTVVYVAFRDVGCHITDGEGEYLDTVLVNDWFHNVYIRQT